MHKKYLVTGLWYDKESGEPKNSVREINEGLNKGGRPYQLLKDGGHEFLDAKHPIGTILTYSMTLKA